MNAAEQQRRLELRLAAGERARRAIKRLERAMGTTLIGSEAVAPGRIAHALRAVLDDRGLEMLKRQRDTLKRLLEITEEGIRELEAWKEKLG